MGAATIRTAAFDPHRDLAPDGCPRADRLADAPQWAPGWDWSRDDGQAAALIGRLAALCDRRGVPAFAPADKTNRLTPTLRHAAEAVELPADSPVRPALAALPPNRQKGVSFPPWEAETGPGFLSDPAAVGLLRTEWSRTADALALTWAEGVGIELRAKGRRLLSGSWGVTVAVNGEPLDLSDGWACVCHHADDEGGFLELQWSGECGAGAVRVERQAYLSREGDFALISDAVRLPDAERTAELPIEHVMTLPMAAGVSGGVAPETREARLFSGSKNWQRARVFPLAVPQYPGGQDPGGAGGGSAVVEGGVLTVRHAARGGLAAPIAFDWSRWREEDLAEWRPLTVTQDRQRLTSAQAVAHRLRIGGGHHLMVYRRTDESPAPRAVLGHHLDRETLIAEFSRKGEVTALLDV